MILTDSGGMQEEASSLGKSILVMCDTTERPEGIAVGTLKLVAYNLMSCANNPYGDAKTIIFCCFNVRLR